MKTSEKFCLKWNDFQENLSSVFGSLRENIDFADVTLACEDGQQVEAHKLILAASSSFFQNIFLRDKHQHPLIYMTGMKSEDLIAIVDFLYHGEANVYHDNLDAFLAIAEELKLKGLAQNNSSEESMQKNSKPKLFSKEMTFEEITHKADMFQDKNLDSHGIEKGSQIAQTDAKVSVDLQELDETIRSMIEIGEKILTGSQAGQNFRICKVCRKQGYQSTIKDHIECNHIEGMFHFCDTCEKKFRSRRSLRSHKSTDHKK